MTRHDHRLAKAAPRLRLPLGALLLTSLYALGCGEQVVAFPADTLAPTVVASSPDDAAFGVALNRSVTVRFDEAMDPDTLTPTSFTLFDGATPIAGAVTFAGLTATFAPDVDLDASTTYSATVTASATDLAGNPLAEDFHWTFMTGLMPDTLRPVVTLTIPGPLATESATSANVVAVFSEQMDPGTFDQATFTLAQGINVVAGQVTLLGATAIFDPDAELAFDTEYTATVTNAVADLAGNTLLANHTWVFRTVMAATPPRVILTSPVDLANRVRRDTRVTATFSEAMNAASALSSFTLRDGNDDVVAGALLFDAPTQTLVFTPTALLLASITYRATVSTDAENALGAPLAADFSWVFTIGSQALGVQPVNLGSLWSFVAVAGSGLTNSNSSGTTVLGGDVGIFPGTSCQGDGVDCSALNPVVTGTLFVADPGMAAARAKVDLTAAYVDAMSRPPGVTVEDLSGMTLTAGVYTSGSTMSIAVGATLTLDGGGDPDAVFIFQVGSSLTVNNDAQVVLINGARARNVFWAVFASSTLGSDVSFQGSVLAGASNSVGTDSVVVGRLLCTTGQITLLSNTIALPL